MKPTILIVEDDKAVRDSLRMVLEIYGYDVEEFASGEEFLARATPKRGSCVILDVNLPGVSGLKTLEKLRATDTAIPAVLMSGRATDEMHAEARRLNALAFFDKPVDIDNLLSAIDAVGRC